MRMPPTETITVARADETTTDGRRTTGAPTAVGAIQALVEPCAYDRTDTAGRRTITHGCNLYHRGGLPFGIPRRRPAHRPKPDHARHPDTRGLAARRHRHRREDPCRGRRGPMSKIRFVLNRKNVERQLLHNKALLDNVQAQVERAAAGDPRITVYRNDDASHGNVVATAPVALEAKHGTLTRIPGQVSV
ncbi:MAG: hypothetical protein ACLUAM_09625 [Bifidobacterium adolescentis]